MGRSLTKPFLSSPKKASPEFHAFFDNGEMQDSFVLANPDDELTSKTLQ